MATSSGSDHLEEGSKESLDFSKLRQIAGIEEDVLPVVVQDSSTKEVLILAYINRLALDESLKTGIATFWSTSRNELWVKGATSGNALGIDEVRINCEQNSVVFLVTPQGGGACHTKDSDGQYRTGCYYRRVNDAGDLEFV
ncbi:MAG: phosphoribosyl-AMP cyclohydrolase [Gemmatimonadetes bacterium]|nr:phosphoribosyl-AMP cyclohydrolase [Gemmatimonadota bacterium]MYA78459.1 phosphoribosyl-AMP cyclohydrolase [Gemmatimonadota bacterium]MYG16992.1 phosphoribosyl-AMP cyclohydrolase [Gemmatimonadota bacterium]MYH18777.1 phosphoribosyl-AMP cyclohydrolase [Gemmatimonadota bacterium]MYK97381.1 phosphoribosyl-AMP cyclohydrolase [Gemmatimonadota bacterium]